MGVDKVFNPLTVMGFVTHFVFWFIVLIVVSGGVMV